MHSISCPVCWGQMETATAGCTRCQTPHHEECFAFTGGCAVFACGGKTIGPVSFSAPALEIDSSADMTPETLAARLAHDAPRPPSGLPRGAVQRISDAYKTLARNWRVAMAVAMLTASFTTSGAILMEVTPSTGLKKVSPAKPTDNMVARIGKELEVADTCPMPTATHDGLGREIPPEMPSAASLVGIVLFVIGQSVMPFFYGVLVMVFLFARARGKDLPACEFVSAALSRAGRCIGVSLTTAMLVIVPYVLAVCVGALIHAAVALLVGFVGFFWMIYMLNEYCLVVAVAAAGADEEPGGMLDLMRRSRQLVALDRGAIWGGNILATVFMWMGIAFVVMFTNGTSLVLGHYWLRVGWETAGMIVGTMLALVMPVYQAILYFECRRTLDREFLKFAPSGLTGADIRAE